MTTTEIASIIEKSINEITERNHKNDCQDCRIVDRDNRESMIEALGQLIDLELFKLEQSVDEIMEDVFRSKKENPEFYKKLDDTEEHLNAIRRTAEIKRFFEARNDGINKVRFHGCD